MIENFCFLSQLFILDSSSLGYKLKDNKIVVKNEKNILLNCLYSETIHDLKWLLPDNKTIVSFKKQNVEASVKVLENNSLLIENASKQDYGVYTCIVMTINGDRFFKYAVISTNGNVFGPF